MINEFIITKITRKGENLWPFAKAKKCFDKKKTTKNNNNSNNNEKKACGRHKGDTTSKLIRCVREQQSCLMDEKPHG